MDIIKKWTQSSFILKIIVGLIIGAILGIAVPQWQFISLIGDIFVSALKAIAPIMVFILVAAAISRAETSNGSKFKMIIILFLLTNFIAAVISIIACQIYPVSIHLSASSNATAPVGIGDVINGMIRT